MTTQIQINLGAFPDTDKATQHQHGKFNAARRSTRQGLILALAALAGLTLAGGCAGERQARYSRTTTTAYPETTVTQVPPAQPGAVVVEGKVVVDQDSVNRAPASAGAAESPRGQYSGEASSFDPDDLITDPATLVRGHDTANFEGRPVRFFALRVEEVMDGRLLLISENGRSLYATCRDQTPAICAGDTVTISGTLRRGDGSDAGLAAPVAQPPNSQPYYVETDKIVNDAK